jgi:hypothetical protein
MDLFARLTQWQDYLNGVLALAEIDERTLDALRVQARAHALIREWGGTKEDRVTISQAQRDVDPEVVAVTREFDGAHNYRKLVEVLYTNAERDASLVSRELTRRVGRQEIHSRRGARWRP